MSERDGAADGYLCPLCGRTVVRGDVSAVEVRLSWNSGRVVGFTAHSACVTQALGPRATGPMTMP